jgi:hypothetical protein
MNAAQIGRTHGSTRPPCINVTKSLAKREPSTHGVIAEVIFEPPKLRFIARTISPSEMAEVRYPTEAEVAGDNRKV